MSFPLIVNVVNAATRADPYFDAFRNRFNVNTAFLFSTQKKEKRYSQKQNKSQCNTGNWNKRTFCRLVNGYNAVVVFHVAIYKRGS